MIEPYKNVYSSTDNDAGATKIPLTRQFTDIFRQDNTGTANHFYKGKSTSIGAYTNQYQTKYLQNSSSRN